MIDIRFDHHQAVLEIEVYDRYESVDVPKVVDAYLEMVRRHPQYMVLEIVHKGWGNWISFFAQASEHIQKISADADEVAKITSKLKRYAIVTERRQLAKAYALLLAMSGVSVKVFASHEQFNARLWLSGQLSVAS